MREILSFKTYYKHNPRMMDWLSLSGSMTRTCLHINCMILYLSTPQPYREQVSWYNRYFTQEIMITSQYCITEDTDNNYYVSIPNKEPKLPNWKKILRVNTNAPVPLKDVIDSIREYGNGNQAKVNQILSKHI